MENADIKSIYRLKYENAGILNIVKIKNLIEV